jgi:hypothetical protein
MSTIKAVITNTNEENALLASHLNVSVRQPSPCTLPEFLDWIKAENTRLKELAAKNDLFLVYKNHKQPDLASAIPWPTSSNCNYTVCPLCHQTFYAYVDNRPFANCPTCGPINDDPKWNFYHEFYRDWYRSNPILFPTMMVVSKAEAIAIEAHNSNLHSRKK